MNAHVAKPIDIKTILAVFDQVFEGYKTHTDYITWPFNSVIR